MEASMSSLTMWLLLFAAALLALLAINAVVYRKRFGTLAPARRFGPPRPKRPVGGEDLVLLCLFVASLLLGVGAPYIEPESAFTAWLLGPYARVAYFAWCFLGCVCTMVVWRVYKYHVSRDKR